jgi:UDP-N-acetylmuramyl pentapeptide phosphotransferase/UDP-N-acetylglucosamine-1-phosphate transferase
VLELSVAFVVTGLMMVPVLALLRRHEVLDVPNLRSSHAVVVPRGGGVAVMLGVLAGVLSAFLVEPGRSATPDAAAVVIALGVVLFAVLGLVDDLWRVRAGVRLVLQVALAAVVAMSVAVGTSSPWAGSLVAVVGALWLVSYVNAFNFMDGINAISALSALLAACWFGALAHHDSEPFLYAASWALAGASLAFLPWNAPRAKVFLGDVGSYGMGALIGVLALLTAQREHDVWVAVAPLVVYLVDTSGALVRRAVRREPLLEAHRSHAYQRLLRVGFSHVGAAGVVLLAGVVICLATLALPTPGAVLVAACVAAAYLLLTSLLEARHRAVASSDSAPSRSGTKP